MTGQKIYMQFSGNMVQSPLLVRGGQYLRCTYHNLGIDFFLLLDHTTNFLVSKVQNEQVDF